MDRRASQWVSRRRVFCELSLTEPPALRLPLRPRRGYPRKGAEVRDRPLTPLEEDRTPVYVDTVSTLSLPVAAPTDDPIVVLLGDTGGLDITNAAVFVGNGSLRYGIRQKAMTSLRARVHCTYQASGGLADSRIASQLARVLERLELRISEDASGELVMPALPIRAFAQGVTFLGRHQPFCDSDDFRLEVTAPAAGLPTVLVGNATLVSAELYFEAVF